MKDLRVFFLVLLFCPGALFAQATLPTRAAPATQPILSSVLEDTSLKQAVAHIQAITGANIVVNWKVLETAGVTGDSRVQVRLSSKVTFRKLLDLVLASASPEVPLVFELQDNIITITTQAEADKRMVTRMYPVEDLLITPIPVAKAKFDLAAGGSGGNIGTFQTDQAGHTSQDEKTVRAATGEEFVRLVTTNIRPEIWKQNGGSASITLYQGKLIVTAPLSVHEKLRG